MLAHFVDASVVFVALADGADLRIAYLHDHGIGRPFPGILAHPRGYSWHSMRTGQSLLLRTPEDWKQFERHPINADRPESDDSRSGMFVPLLSGDERLGTLSVQSRQADVYDESDLRLLEAIARYVGIAVHNQRLFSRLQRVVDSDPLTGLASHSSLLRALDDFMADPHARRVGVIMLDVTNFGMINDVQGTRAGDRALQMVAERIAGIADEHTVVGRFGGDDFAIVAERNDRAQIAALVDEVARHLRGLSLVRADLEIPIPVNIGWASAPDEAATRSTLMALVELRLRLSLQAGGIPVGGEMAEIERYGDFTGIESLVESALLRDPYTRSHLLHVNHLAHRWGPRLGLEPPQREVLRVASLLHDIGKLLIPDPILLKPARLTPGEYETMKRHAEYGEHILRGYARYTDVARIVGQHHERIDGRGYPSGLRGNEIDQVALAVAIIDAYSAMTLDRPYHRAVGEAAALEELERCAGTQFDAEMVRSFVDLRREAGAA